MAEDKIIARLRELKDPEWLGEYPDLAPLHDALIGSYTADITAAQRRLIGQRLASPGTEQTNDQFFSLAQKMLLFQRGLKEFSDNIIKELAKRAVQKICQEEAMDEMGVQLAIREIKTALEKERAEREGGALIEEIRLGATASDSANPEELKDFTALKEATMDVTTALRQKPLPHIFLQEGGKAIADDIANMRRPKMATLLILAMAMNELSDQLLEQVTTSSTRITDALNQQAIREGTYQESVMPAIPTEDACSILLITIHDSLTELRRLEWLGNFDRLEAEAARLQTSTVESMIKIEDEKENPSHSLRMFTPGFNGFVQNLDRAKRREFGQLNDPARTVQTAEQEMHNIIHSRHPISLPDDLKKGGALLSHIEQSEHPELARIFTAFYCMSQLQQQIRDTLPSIDGPKHGPGKGGNGGRTH